MKNRNSILILNKRKKNIGKEDFYCTQNIPNIKM